MRSADLSAGILLTKAGEKFRSIPIKHAFQQVPFYTLPLAKGVRTLLSFSYKNSDCRSDLADATKEETDASLTREAIALSSKASFSSFCIR